MKSEETKYFTESGKVICQLCGKSYKMITATHLKKFHQLSVEQYREQFPDAPVSSKEFRAKQKYKHSTILKQTESSQKEASVKTEVVVDNQKEKIIEIKESDVISEPAATTHELWKPDYVFVNRVQAYEYLKYKLNSEMLKMNYLVRIFTLSGHLDHAFITDVVDIKNKIDFEFTGVRWHNTPAIIGEQRRNSIMIKNGRRVISIREQAVTPKVIDFYLDNFLKK